MNITILGASGKVGRELTRVLLEHGHHITALVHNSNSLTSNPSLTVITGDVHSAEDITKAIAGSTVIVSTVGSWGTPTKDILSSATKNLITAMHTAKINRYISVTGAGAVLPGENLGTIASLNRLLLLIIGRPILKDAEEHLRLLEGSTLEWSSLRSPVMTTRGPAVGVLRLTPPAPWTSVSRQAVVSALVDMIENNTYIKQAPYITKK